MYESFFRFERRPFRPAPTTEAYYGAQCIESSRQTLARVIERAEGPGLVIGPAGVGKSLLCRLLADQFRKRFRPVLLTGAQVDSRKALFQNILFELGLDYRGLDESEMRLALADYLQSGDIEALLLILDEAHALPAAMLDEIRMLGNLVRGGESCVRVVLAGGASLEELFADPRLDSFNQRVAARCYLHSLHRDETFNYVRRHIAAAGGQPESVLSEEALQGVYVATDGIPRLINQLCDQALLLAAQRGAARLTAELVNEAWAELQQLPAPWSEPAPAPAAESGIVEFGSLDDDAQQPSAHVVKEEEPAALIEEPMEGRASGIEQVDDEGPSDEPTEVEEDEETFLAAATLHPFGEGFDEEELIVDPYAVLQADQPLGQPSPAPYEAGEPMVEDSSATVADGDEAHAEGADDEEIVFNLAAEQRKMSSGADDAAVSDEPEPTAETFEEHAEQNRDAEADELRDESASLVAMNGNFAPRRRLDAPGDDRDMIIVEEDADVVVGRRAGPPGRARRQEYRNLFARLRRES